MDLEKRIERLESDISDIMKILQDICQAFEPESGTEQELEIRRKKEKITFNEYSSEIRRKRNRRRDEL